MIATNLITHETASRLAPTITRSVSLDFETGCHLRTKGLAPNGYSRVSATIDGKYKSLYAHRVMWTYLRGSIPDGMTIDHLCKRPNCVNVQHMEVVTLRVNVLRSDNPAAQKARETHCKVGHPLPKKREGQPRTCIECRKLRRKGKFLLADDPRHGTTRGYGYYFCRCPECKKAMSDYTRERKSQREGN